MSMDSFGSVQIFIVDFFYFFENYLNLRNFYAFYEYFCFLRISRFFKNF